MASLPYSSIGPVVTVAASPFVTPWFDTSNFSQIVPMFVAAGGTTAVTAEGSFDGVNLDADISYGAALTSGTPVTVLSPFIRLKWTQTVADATKSKIFVHSRV